MVLKSTGVSKSRRLAARKSRVKSAFEGVEPLSIWMGGLTKTFAFDSRAAKRPKLVGPVVASVSVSRDRAAILQLYPVDRRQYSELASAAFEAEVLGHMREWLDRQLSKPETAVLGYEELIVEWRGGKHQTHELRYL